MIHPVSKKPLKQKIFWHLKVLAGSLFIAVFFSLVLEQKIIHSQSLSMLLLTFLQLELFIWLGTLFFYNLKESEPGFKRKMLVRLVLFYLTVLVVASVFFLGVFYIHFRIGNLAFNTFAEALANLELKGFYTSTLIGFTLGALFFFYSQWNDALKREQKLVHEKLIFQNETLKSQVNPHFLFNSLNTLSSFVHTDAGLSEKYIQKLSSVYRYILENMEIELVPVSRELDFVNDFFYLQKLRDQEKIELKIEISHSGKALTLPVSLQMLVENALKHNVAKRENPLVITIHNEGIDKVVVRNNLQKKTQLVNSSKIGLKNLNERCRLILKREIEIVENEEEFVVKIPVKVN